MKNRYTFRLNVEKMQRDCLFVLSWGKAQQVKAVLAYPDTLSGCYQTWQRAYSRYYQTALRGHLVEAGGLTPMDSRQQLLKAQARLLDEFNSWLRSEKLFVIKSEIVHFVKYLRSEQFTSCLDIFLTCQPLELEKLPWESWEIEREIALPVPIRIARTAANIRSQNQPRRNRLAGGKARILGIFGDDTGLDFQQDLQALRSLSSLAEVKIVSWRSEKTIAQLKTEICQAIADTKGWDILFFAGHSQSTELTGGELSIAPKTVISLREIEPQLQQALARGLQFALFNSCSGISIANTLIDMGLGQVAIMREPIHNQVAQVFLVQFLQALANYQDVLESLREACQFLQREKNLYYPSAYLIPSLFCHPEAQLFRIEPCGWKSCLEEWLPNRSQGIILSSLALLSLLPPLSDILLNGRTLMQAIYRDITNQVPSITTPPVLLVEINEESLQRARITQRYPLDRAYLAELIERLAAAEAQVIGLDYLLDWPQEGKDVKLAKSIDNALQKQGVWFVFATKQEAGKEIHLLPSIVDKERSLQGSIEGHPQYIPSPEECDNICPFSYLLFVAYMVRNNIPEPHISELSKDIPQQIRPHLSAGTPWLKWLRPIHDFSLPPDTIYQGLPAWQLLERFPSYPINQQVILIASGGYQEAGIDGERDYFTTPLGLAFWRYKNYNSPAVLTGGQVHAYSLHHWLTRHLVIVIPALWMLGLAAGLGKAMALRLTYQRRPWLWGFLATVVYSLISLQVYISAAILLPWLLPAIAFWSYLLPLGEKSNYEK